MTMEGFQERGVKFVKRLGGKITESIGREVDDLLEIFGGRGRTPRAGANSSPHLGDTLSNHIKDKSFRDRHGVLGIRVVPFIDIVRYLSCMLLKRMVTPHQMIEFRMAGTDVYQYLPVLKQIGHRISHVKCLMLRLQDNDIIGIGKGLIVTGVSRS